MKYQIRHTTRYAYSEPVPVCHNQVHLAPRSLSHQTCHEFKLLVSPAPVERRRREDFYGNQVDYFSIHEPHTGLTITADSLVEVEEPKWPQPTRTLGWESVASYQRFGTDPQRLQACGFTVPSRYVPLHRMYGDYARPSFPPGRPLLDAVLDLTSRIHTEFRYDPRATTIHTRLADVFALRAGVCQDFAHLQIACLRSLGLAARYVSGYISNARGVAAPGASPTNDAGMVGADASHAWLSCWDGGDGWLDVDPTNDCVAGALHVTVGWGRDYADVSPVKGVCVGGGAHRMDVAVHVVRIA